jgi:hypothetical protein
MRIHLQTLNRRNVNITQTYLVKDVKTDREYHVFDDYSKHCVRTTLYITLAGQCLGRL